MKAIGDKLVVRTKLCPPRPQRHILQRSRLTSRLLEATDYRLTIVQAGTGYGKSTALAALSEEQFPLVWYHLDAEDLDPLIFLLHLIYGFSAILPNDLQGPLTILEQWERNGGEAVWERVVDMLVSELAAHNGQPLLLVIDDAHLLQKTGETLRILDRLIGRAPSHLHLILSTRYPLQLPTLIAWRVRGELLEVGQDELSFTIDEVITLFRTQYEYELTQESAEQLMAQVEGWPIALPLVWQRLQSGEDVSLSRALGHLSGASGDLFAYLAQEVLAQQPGDVRDFLRQTSVLRQMTAGRCDCIRQSQDSAEMLQHLLAQGLFVVDLGEGHLRYHHLFRELLCHGLAADEAGALHRRAAACYCERGEDEEVLHHLLAAGAEEDAARLLAQIGKSYVQAGRLDRLEGGIGSLAPPVLQRHPPLLSYLGDIARLRSRFDEALGWYRQAEAWSRSQGDMLSVGQALRGQARVYLDTVNPSQAEQLLLEALRISDGQKDRESRATLLDLLAENLLNQGKLEPAQSYQAEAQDLRERGSDEAELSMRVLLRTGRLAEAREKLEERVEAERRNPVLRPRAHRETLLLLSLIYAFQGVQERAQQTAEEGTSRGKSFASPFVVAVGLMRQGHAWLLRKDDKGYREAANRFQAAVRMSEEMTVPRLRVEASWGLCQAYGFRGELQRAKEVAERGIAIAREAGDEWVEACIRVTMGASLVLAKQYGEASEWLAQAASAFRACADSYGEATVHLWQCLIWHEREDEARLGRDVEALLHLARENGYAFLFQRKTLFGPPDPRGLIPLLLFARERGREAAYASRLLQEMGLAGLELHPGYQLRLQLLGPFRLWRGAAEVPPGEWKRQKARQLLHLLLTYRHTMLEREQITEILWPELEPEAAQRDFKIAYSGLCRALEPERRRNAPSAYVIRDGSRYGWRPTADVWLDVDIFTSLVQEGDELFGRRRSAALDLYRQALALYQGEFLQEFPYAEWASEERERLLTLYLRTAERLANALLEESAWEETVDVCYAILARDDCWEHAYRTMMVAYARLGKRAQAVRAYHRCVARLDSELNVAPTGATVALYKSICDGQGPHDAIV